MWVTNGMSAIHLFMRAWARTRAGPSAASAAFLGALPGSHPALMHLSFTS